MAAAELRRQLAVLAVLVAGCGHGPKPSSAFGDVGGSAPGSAAPAQFSDLAPGDTTGVITMMRNLMREIDAAAATLKERDTTIVTDSVAHHYTLWLQDGVPRKLIAIDSTSSGNSETDVWFLGGDVAVLQQPADAYAFDTGRIVLWTDEALQPRADVTAAMVMQKQSTLMDAVGGWLKVFGSALP